MYVITGGGSGIGRSLAISLAKRDQSVMIIGRRVAALQQTAAQDHRISYLQVDISSEEGRDLLVGHLDQFKRLSGLIHNAAIIKPIVPITEISLEQFRQIMSTNVEAPFHLNQKLLTKLKGGRILHIGSGAAYFPIKGWAGYCISKAALSMVTKSWQIECDDPIFSSVMPGIIDSPMQAEIRRSLAMDPEKLAFFQRLKTDDQLISCDAVALFLTWLLLDLNRENYASKEWDIYDDSHHHKWLKSPYKVPLLEE